MDNKISANDAYLQQEGLQWANVNWTQADEIGRIFYSIIKLEDSNLGGPKGIAIDPSSLADYGFQSGIIWFPCPEVEGICCYTYF